MARYFGRPIVMGVGHCTASNPDATVQQILDYWKYKKHWKNVGYHYIIGRKGERHILAKLSQVVNGVRGHNWNKMHFSWIGGKGGINNMTGYQADEIVKLVTELRTPEILGPIPFVGHRDLSPDLNGDGIITSNEWTKLCPSMDMVQFLTERGVL